MSGSLSQPDSRVVQGAVRPIQILIVDDIASIRIGRCEVFNSEPDFEVCGQASNGQEAIRTAQSLRPDLIILDFAMPVMNGLDAARALRKVMPHVPLLMYSAFGDKYVEQQAGFIGIAGLISKGEPASKLVEKARSLLRDRLSQLKGKPMTNKGPTQRSTHPEKGPPVHTTKDQDKGKGATEEDRNRHGGNTGMQRQLSHRDKDAELKDADSDLPG